MQGSKQRSNVIADLRQDLSYAVRVLRRNVSLTVLIVGALAMGVGANTAIFTLIDAVILRQLPVSQPEQLVGVGDPARLVQAARCAVLSVDPTLPIDAIDPVSKLIAESISQQRVLAQLAAGFGILALMLAAIGLYGVMTYAITRRTGEIGLRVALGAQRADVIRMVLSEALQLVAIGLGVGLPLALLATRLMRAQLHGVGPSDPASLGLAIAMLGASGVIAVLVPALRAAGLSPMNALRIG